MDGSLLYTTSFFTEQRAGARGSAEVLAKFLIEICHPTSVVDLGGGTGTWLAVFKELGVPDVLGVDGTYIDLSQLEVHPNEFLAHDLTEPLSLPRRFALAICLEVAEHLPAHSSPNLVNSLARLSDIILFSAAIPGQVGRGHVNLRRQSEWVADFRDLGYVAIDCIRPLVWCHPSVQYWYAQNTFLYVKQELVDGHEVFRDLAARTNYSLLDLVHPQMQAYTEHCLEEAKRLNQTLGVRDSFKLLANATKKAVEARLGGR